MHGLVAEGIGVWMRWRVECIRARCRTPANRGDCRRARENSGHLAW